MNNTTEIQYENFDFESHKEKAVKNFENVRPLYETFSLQLKDIIVECLKCKSIRYHSIENRAKSIASFAEKAIKHSDNNPNKPKYLNPLEEITDLAGIRIITFLLPALNEVNKLIFEEFEVIEKSDKNDLLDQKEKLGYQSVHYLVKLKNSRASLTEYNKFKGLIAEIQVRTILQHAWAEIEHDIEYKSITTIPSSIKRRFMALAGMIEIADREFQSIHDEDNHIRAEARKSVKEGKLDTVEITQDSLKTYLDKKLGSDRRMSDFSYSWEAKMLIKMGFSTLQQIDDCIKDLNDDKISRAVWGIKQGQIRRFDSLLMAGMGENFIKKHPWNGIDNGYWDNTFTERLEKIKKAKVAIKNYCPPNC